MRFAVALVFVLVACRDHPEPRATPIAPTLAAPAPIDAASIDPAIDPPPVAPPVASPSTPATSSGPWGIARAPASLDRKRPAIVYMHGMWASPEDSCSFFEDAAAPHGFLVCPRGNAPLGAGKMWGGAMRAVTERVDAALDAAEALAPGMLDDKDGTLIGFSNGAAYAMKLALERPGRWTGLVLMAMELAPDAARLKAAGVRRIVFAAGDLDGSRASLERAARAMNAAGLPSRYVSLGPVGHSFAPDMGAKMTDAIAWVRGD